MKFKPDLKSIKVNILIIPIMLFILSIVVTSMTTLYFTNKTIRSAMEERGIELLKYTECSCGYIAHRDIHGARNILLKGTRGEIRIYQEDNIQMHPKTFQYINS